MRMIRVLVPALAFLATFGVASAGTAQASEVTRVASSFEEDNKFDLHFGVGYDFDFKKASILRENAAGGDGRLNKDLIFQQQRQTVTVGLEIGLYHDLSVYAELPIVVADNRNYSFDNEAANCVYPQDVGSGAANDITDINCVNKTNSTTIRDQIVPRNGFDAKNTTNPYGQYTGEDTDLIFQGPVRRGLDQLNVGLKYGILNQDKRPHLPNWVIAFEGRFAIGTPMEFTRNIQVDDPATNHSVGRGTHELGLWTALSRRYRFLEPFFGAHWRQALRASNTRFEKYADQVKFNPQSEAGLYVGTEIIPWERKAKAQKIAIILAGSARLKYGGRAYSEIWEILADSPALVGTNSPGRGQCNRQAALDYAATTPNDPVGFYDEANAAPNSGDCEKFEGITDVDDFAIFGARFALDFNFNKYARLMIGADLQTQTQHYLTNASRGDPDQSGDPDIVEPDQPGANPIRREVIDQVGRRYAIGNVFNVVGFANFLLTF